MYFVPGFALEVFNDDSVERDYNRCFRDKQVFETRMKDLYNYMLYGFPGEENVERNDELVNNAIKNTNGDWRQAMFPIDMLMVHKHKNMQRCEPHARIWVGHVSHMIIDIAMEHWDKIVELNEEVE